MALALDQKFSTFADGGNLAISDTVVGLRGGINTKFNYTGELPPGFIVPISQGGTGATTATGARINLGLGTMAVQNADAVAITGGVASLTTVQLSDAGILDSNGNTMLSIQPIALAVNHLNITNAIAGGNVAIGVLGPSANIGMSYQARALGQHIFTSTNPSPVVYNSGTTFQHTTTFAFPNTATSRTVTFQDSSGTVAYLSDVAGVVTSITGTANQVIASSPTGAVTLSLPQSIATTSDVQFNSVRLSTSGILDSNGNTLVGFAAYNPGAVNYFNVTNAISGEPVPISAQGADPNVGLSIYSKGTGIVTVLSENITTPFSIWSGTTKQHKTNFAIANTAASRTVTLQDASGTLAFLTDIPAGSPSALTRVNDTNVTVTLGGTPATALLQAVSLTLGWSGTLAETRGGTNQSTYATGDTLYASAANTLSKLTGNITTAKQYLSQTGSGAVSSAPAWATIAGSDITGAALTKVDDTNVTLTLGGTPATALLRAASLTLGWTGTLSGTRGGTGVNNDGSTITLGGSLTTSGAFASTFTMTGITGVTFPTSGTLATTSQLVTPAALTKVDDTNVTLTLGGSPSTALVNAASLTLGWTGQLGLTRGGTAASLTASNGGIIYSTASAMAVLAGTATANQHLQSGASGAPSWTTTTYPSTNAINTIMYASSANILGSIAAANSSVLVTSAGGVPSLSTALPSGLTATNMNLTTPTLGAATATSINFGGTTLSTYAEGTWTPVFTFATPGDLSVAYTSQLGIYTRIGRMITVTFYLQCAPTYTTASGGASITGLPFASSNAAGNEAIGSLTGVQNMTFPTGCTYIYTENPHGTSVINLNAGGTAIAQNTHITTTNMATTLTQIFQGTVTYFI